MSDKHTTVTIGSTVTIRREFTMTPKTYKILGYGDKALIDEQSHYYFVEILDVKSPLINQ